MSPPRRDAKVQGVLARVDSALRRLYQAAPEDGHPRTAWVRAINACLLEVEKIGRDFGPRYPITTKKAAKR